MSFQRFEKLQWEPVESLMSLPNLYRHSVDCPKCNFRHPVKSEYTDWKEVSERYKNAYHKMAQEFVKLLEEAGNEFDVPLKEYFEASQMELKQLLKELIDRT